MSVIVWVSEGGGERGIFRSTVVLSPASGRYLIV